VLMPCKWRFGDENLNQAWCIILIGAANSKSRIPRARRDNEDATEYEPQK